MKLFLMEYHVLLCIVDYVDDLKTFLRDYLGIFPKRHTAAAASIVGHHQGHLHYKSSFGANKEYLGHADTLLSVTLVLDIKLTLGDPE